MPLPDSWHRSRLAVLTKRIQTERRLGIAGTDSLVGLHRRIEDKVAQWFSAPTTDLKAEIAELELRAAAIIRSKADSTLIPLEASFEDARKHAREFLARQK